MFEVLEIRTDQTAVVSTKGLYRVVLPNGKVVCELEPRSHAKAYIDSYNTNTPKGHRAKIVPYSRAL